MSCSCSASATWGRICALITCPPSKPISILIRSLLAMGNDLREDAVEGVGVDEGNLQTEETAAGLLVDELRPTGGELVERRLDVLDLVRDVVHAGAPVGEELPDGGLAAERGEQLDAARADAHRRRLDPLLGDGGAMLDPGAQQPLVRAHRLVEVGDGDAEVVDSARLHR